MLGDIDEAVADPAWLPPGGFIRINGYQWVAMDTSEYQQRNAYNLHCMIVALKCKRKCARWSRAVWAAVRRGWVGWVVPVAAVVPRGGHVAVTWQARGRHVSGVIRPSRRPVYGSVEWLGVERGLVGMMVVVVVVVAVVAVVVVVECNKIVLAVVVVLEYLEGVIFLQMDQN